MPYCVEADISSKLGAQNMIPFLDDDADGLADDGLLDTIIECSDAEINGYLASIYTVPISPTIPLLKNYSIVFTCEAMYGRRLVPEEKNPWTDRANRAREHLTRVGNGELPLDLTVPREFTQGTAITRGTMFGPDGSNLPSNTQ